MKILSVSAAVFLLLIFLSPSRSGAETPPSSNTTSTAQAGSEATPVLPEIKTYEELRQAISLARIESRGRVEKAVEQGRVREAWEIGRLIDAHVLQHQERADYGERILKKLAADLGMSKTELSYMLQFARAYPIVPHAEQLSWSEYRELLSVNDPQERQAIAEQAAKESWPRDRLREEVKAVTKKEKTSVPTAAIEMLSPSAPGKPGTYKIIRAKTGPYAKELAVDLGFSNYVRLAALVETVRPFNEGDVLTFSQEQGETQKAQPEDLYTYRAWVYRVLDGDTIEAVVDLGFELTTTQVLRLRGIDAPEIETRDGKEAKEALEKMLKIPGGGGRREDGKANVPVLIKTMKSDKYDRYLADLFVPGKKGSAQYLNNRLLEEGMAVKVQS